MQRAVPLLIAGLVLAGCQARSPDLAETTVEPIAGIDTRTGPIVDLGEVETVDGDRVGLSAFANEAGGICLDLDDGRVPTCSPSAAPVEGVELISLRGDDARACAFSFAPTDVTDVIIEELDTGRELVEAELLPASAELGLHIFAGCYEDPSLVETVLRDATEDTREAGP